jgi:hypothetical protein
MLREDRRGSLEEDDGDVVVDVTLQVSRIDELRLVTGQQEDVGERRRRIDRADEGVEQHLDRTEL